MVGSHAIDRPKNSQTGASPAWAQGRSLVPERRTRLDRAGLHPGGASGSLPWHISRIAVFGGRQKGRSTSCPRFPHVPACAARERPPSRKCVPDSGRGSVGRSRSSPPRDRRRRADRAQDDFRHQVRRPSPIAVRAVHHRPDVRSRPPGLAFAAVRATQRDAGVNLTISKASCWRTTAPVLFARVFDSKIRTKKLETRHNGHSFVLWCVIGAGIKRRVPDHSLLSGPGPDPDPGFGSALLHFAPQR